MDPEHRPFYVEDRPLPRRPGLMGEINSSVDSIDREPTILAGTVSTFQAKNTQPVSVIYAPRLRQTTYPPVSKTWRNVRVKHGRENMTLGRTLMPASATKIRVALRVVPPSRLNTKAAPVSLLGGLFLRSAGRSGSRGSGPVLIRPSVRPMVAGALFREMAGFRLRSCSASATSR